MRRFVVIGQRAIASSDFSMLDIAGTSGRLDVLLRCVRAGFLVSHGLRQDTVMYLVLMGGTSAPKTLRIEGASAKFIRPDERSLATLVRKVLMVQTGEKGFVPVRPGISMAVGGLDCVLADLGVATKYVLEPNGSDIRETVLDLEHPVFFLGDHLGFDKSTRATLEDHGALSLGLGPVDIHAEDAVTVVLNELDRRGGMGKR
jgi:tRNA (pseudouridine54-N1)-methyltransferase